MVAMVTQCKLFAECLMSQESLIPNMNSIHLKTKELLRYHCSCHGNLVAMKYAADVYCPKEV